jgi:hypothetical protein
LTDRSSRFFHLHPRLETQSETLTFSEWLAEQLSARGWTDPLAEVGWKGRFSEARVEIAGFEKTAWRGPFSRLRPTPLPVRLPLFHALVSFGCLSLLPASPLAIPTAFGLATALVFYIQILAYHTGYHLE